MTPERMRVLNSAESDTLTAEEMRQGWHFCPEWDFLLVNMSDEDGDREHCSCKPWTEQQISTLAGRT